MFEALLSNRTVSVLMEALPRILTAGLTMTIPLTLLSFFFAMIIAVAVALVQFAHVPVLQRLARFYIWVIRGTPVLVQLFVVFYGLPGVGILIEPFPAAVLVFSINEGAYCAETIRAALESVPKGQMEAGQCVGMSYLQIIRRIILPQALRNIIPQIGNNFIINIKDTSVLSVISITDLFFVHKSVVGALYTYFESAAIVMVIYLTMTLFASYLLRLWEKALDGPQNYDLNTTDSLAYTSGMYNAPDPNHESQNLDMKGGAAHV